MWPPEDKEPPEMMEPRDREEQYRVSVEWLYDMDDYNEWMNEEDYEVRTVSFEVVEFFLSGSKYFCIQNTLHMCCVVNFYSAGIAT
jgi:hypothetical protein